MAIFIEPFSIRLANSSAVAEATRLNPAASATPAATIVLSNALFVFMSNFLVCTLT